MRAKLSGMPQNDPADILAQLRLTTFGGELGRRIIETHIWAVREGLRSAAAYDLFDGYCQRLVVHGAPAVASACSDGDPASPMAWLRLHLAARSQCDRARAICPRQRWKDADFLKSPLNHLIRRARDGEANPSMRRRLESGPDQRDFPILEEFFALGATDYLAQLYIYGVDGDRSQGTGIVYSFTADRKGGFSEDDVTLVDATLPALSLAMKSHAAYVIASGLLGTYLGEDAGRRVHAGAVTRGSVEKLNAVLWYADIRGFTPISDCAAGEIIVDLLNDVFEVLTATLRPRGGQVLKFIGDGMLATFSFEEADRAETCRGALDAAIEAMQRLDALNADRAAAGVPVASVDLALHIGEVLYGNVGAADRLDFTIIGPAVNEAARIEALCEPLGRSVLVSPEFAAAAAGGDSRLESVGLHALRGVREPKEIFSLDSRPEAVR